MGGKRRRSRVEAFRHGNERAVSYASDYHIYLLTLHIPNDAMDLPGFGFGWWDFSS